MSYIPGDPLDGPDALDLILAELLPAPIFCELCGRECQLHDDNNWCDECEARTEAEEAAMLAELPLLEPITARPVELNAQLWAEWKRIAEKLP
jgi:hypothetical protein